MDFTPTQRRFAAWLGIALLAGLVLWLLGPVLTPFVVGAVLAYALAPLVDRLDRLWGVRLRVLSVLVVELVAITILVLIALMVVPIVSRELPMIREQLPAAFDKLNASLTPWLRDLGVPLTLDFASLREQLLGYLHANFHSAIASLLASLRLGGSVALVVFANALLIPVALFYLLLDWKRFTHLVLEFVPPRLRPGVDSFTDEAGAVLGQYLRGQLLVMLTMALFYAVGLSLFGLDLAVPIGVFTGLAMFVPYVGFGIGLALALLAGLLQFEPVRAFAMVAVVYGSGQVVEGFFLTPRLVGERIGLHPLAVIFALLAFGQLFGFVGVLVALPASAVLLVAIRRVRAGYMGSRLYQG
ncbi:MULTISPECIES: AI-2E family transporter [Ramlibacter]|uniref:AI-2E family transporter n=1 Tax=Ramlibacter aquaticus TaxID=2780094 RepID=A0ABR9S9J2_9BURK|nr:MULTISPECIES: AI-2E family transporter [Ramlibacter]MBE7939023.1 AI-2E family transporter [Ramlibacter aquaticus]